MEQILSLQEMKEFCFKLTQKLTVPHLITLEGELGAGKTQFTQFLTSGLLKEHQAHSPTFSLINEYSGWKFPIYHVDLYRLENAKDLESSGFWDLFDEEALIIIEWSNLLDEKFIPKSWPRWHIKIEHIDTIADKRKITMS
ncbi:MAG: tRNA (adenosine(37)-N6)-threonylcarbamoyltransferase complex ATPase subunit type 1 TsaE [Bdellovibrionales bacterium]|nr:tRNA (adenosine(37)-N6)-threonylcarbamoyltransferase complex ATPase subunit type 1 TsaE [Bdellovibrionales bacterium]